MKGAKLTLKADNSAPSNEELAQAIRKKRAQKVAEDKFNQPSVFGSAVSQGELEMLLEDAENTVYVMEPELPELNESQKKKLQKAFMEHNYEGLYEE